MNNIIKQISFSVFANIFSAVSSVLMILVLPKVMSLEDYGIWQLFIFYFSYVGFFHFGLIDGIYLRYGGSYYSELDRKIFGGQFYLLIFLLLSEFVLINIFLFFHTISDHNVLFVIRVASIGAIFYIVLAFVNFIFQLSNKIKEYARNVVLVRAITLVSILICVILKQTQCEKIICITLISDFLVMTFGLYSIRDLIFAEKDCLTHIISEAWENISAGSKLMLSNIAGMLVLGIIRFGISQGWDIVTFGKVSLSLSISNFLMVFISAVSVVLFPVLKRIDPNKLAEIYVLLRRFLSYFLLAILLIYYPLKLILIYWLPKYGDSLIYMGILLPICIFESKMQMLINTYLKSLRQEALMVKINFISVIFALITTYFTVVVMHNLQYAILAIVVNFAFRLLIAEYFVEKLLLINIRMDSLEELLVVFGFIGINMIDNCYSFYIYLCIYVIYAVVNRKYIKDTMNKLKCTFIK